MTAKHAMFFALFTQGRVSVHLDPRREGVELPPAIRARRAVRLDYGLALPLPTEDVFLSDDGIRCTLSFDRTPTMTFVPWSAIFAVAGPTGDGIAFDEDVPTDIKAAADKAGIDIKTTAQGGPSPRSRFQLVDGELAVGDAAEPAEQRPSPALRLVKKEETDGDPDPAA
jgi:hypothetical protein